MALTFDVGMNERAAVRAAKNLGDSLDDVDKKLDDLSKSGGDIGDGMDRGLRKAKAGLDDFKQEANSTARESAASFDGSADSIADAFQEVAANSFAGFGPLGAAAGLAAAAGLGVVTAEITKQAEEAEFLRERLANAYIEAAQEGRNYISAAQAVSEAQDLMFNPERAGEWKQIQEDAKRLSLDIGVLIDANAGKTEAQATVHERINALIAQEKAAHTETDSIVGNMATNVLGLQNRWMEVSAATEEQKKRAAELSAYSEGANAREREQIQRTRDASQARYEAMAGQAAAAASSAASSIDGIPATKETTVRVRVDDAAWRNWSPGAKFATVYPGAGPGIRLDG